MVCLGSDTHSGSMAWFREPAGIHDQICCLSVARQGRVRCQNVSPCHPLCPNLHYIVSFIALHSYIFSILYENHTTYTYSPPTQPFKEKKPYPTHPKLQLLLIHLNRSRPDRHWPWAFFTSCFGLRLVLCCENLHVHAFVSLPLVVRKMMTASVV
jgi:hypothetical protein